MWNAVDTWRIKIRRDRTSSLSITREHIYRYVHSMFYTSYTSHWTIAFRARLKLHFLTHKFFRPNTPGFAIFPRSKARPFSSSPPDPRSHPVLHPVHIDRSWLPSHLPTISIHALSLSPFPLSTDSFKINTCKPRIFTCSYNYRRSI